jgi:hypothetical protein
MPSRVTPVHTVLHACLQTAATLAASKGLRAISNDRLTCTADHLPPRPAGMPPHAHFIALIFGKELSPSAANFRVFPRHDRR